MTEIVKYLISNYGDAVVTVGVGVIVRWWEKSKLKVRYQARIDRLIEDVREAKYGSK